MIQFRTPRVVATLSCAAALYGTAAARAETVFGLTTQNGLISFDSATPLSISSPISIAGLPANEVLIGIDFRPATGQLYAVGTSNSMYTINTGNGAASPVLQPGGTPFALSGTEYGFDFNPVPDRIRVVSNLEQNLRLNPVNGGLAGTDTPLAFDTDTDGAGPDTADVNAGQNPNIVGAAYTNSFAGATTTTLYGIDSDLDILVRQGGVGVPPGTPSPNTGTLFTIGALNFDTTHLVGFDISAASGFAYASLTAPGDVRSQLHLIDLNSGDTTLVDNIGGLDLIRGIAVVPEPGALSLLGVAAAAACVRRRR